MPARSYPKTPNLPNFKDSARGWAPPTTCSATARPRSRRRWAGMCRSWDPPRPDFSPWIRRSAARRGRGPTRTRDFIPECNLGGRGRQRRVRSDVEQPSSVSRQQHTLALTRYRVRESRLQLADLGIRSARAQAGSGVNVGYFRTWYGNFTVTDNQAVGPADYDPYCVTAPVDARLPGGGGNQICGLYDVKPDAVRPVDNLVTQAANYGKQTEVYNGVDLDHERAVRRGRGALRGLQHRTNGDRQLLPEQRSVVDGPIPPGRDGRKHASAHAGFLSHRAPVQRPDAVQVLRRVSAAVGLSGQRHVPESSRHSHRGHLRRHQRRYQAIPRPQSGAVWHQRDVQRHGGRRSRCHPTRTSRIASRSSICA